MRPRRATLDDRPEVREASRQVQHVALTPSRKPEVPCGWCGLRVATGTVVNTPSCQPCLSGGSKGRVTAYMQRLRRAAKGTP